MSGRRSELIGLLLSVVLAVALDWFSPTVRGLWPGAVAILLGWLLLHRTQQELAPDFSGPQRHEPWLRATGWFLIISGLFNIVLSLLALLF
jgi:hypothetical protein